MELDERIKKALELRSQGYNCAQSVVLAFPDKTGLDDGRAASMCAPLGAGVAIGEICGVPNAMAIVVGLSLHDGAPDAKQRAMPIVKDLLKKFTSSVGGCITCRDLKGKCGKTCDELIVDGITMLHEYFNGK